MEGEAEGGEEEEEGEPQDDDIVREILGRLSFLVFGRSSPYCIIFIRYTATLRLRSQNFHFKIVFFKNHKKTKTSMKFAGV